MKEFIVDLVEVNDMKEFISAFNAGVFNQLDGNWNGSWDAFNDYLSWPEEERYHLLLKGWRSCHALTESELAIFIGLLSDNDQVEVVFA
jgi:hypothetical protein